MRCGLSCAPFHCESFGYSGHRSSRYQRPTIFPNVLNSGLVFENQVKKSPIFGVYSIAIGSQGPGNCLEG